MMRKVILHGHAREMFGECFELNVSTLAEAVRALGAQIKGFRQYIAQRHFRVVVGKQISKGRVLGENQITEYLPKGNIHIRPVVKGAKEGSGLLKIIAGVLIAAVAWWAAPVAAAGGMGAAAIGTVTYGQIAMIGIGLAAAGISQLLTQNKNNKDKDDESARISGNLNTMEQGGPVPLIYGKYRVGSTMISSGVTTADIPID